ncbi:MAG: 3-deoxy-8-phosphooctulonate synthase [candidate division NC10 bacterium]|nr:3-deoxy-8-phosphooctulonate synthase [candidate division NC10 bacterium]
MTREVCIGNIRVGGGNPLALIAGPCVIEGEDHLLKTAERIQRICAELQIPFILKSSYDKANRSSIRSFRGPGLKEGLRILKKARETLGLPVLSDIHQVAEVQEAAEVLDVLQIPAFLCRQTDLVVAAAGTGRPVNAKKGQFLSPWEVKNIIEKATSTGNHNLLLTERGTSFGYNNLVVDMRSLPILRDFGYPVVFDATHSVQLPGGAGTASSGRREFVPYLTRAAVAVGVDALFMEVHPDPDHAPSDGPTMVRLDDLRDLLHQVKRIEEALWR